MLTRQELEYLRSLLKKDDNQQDQVIYSKITLMIVAGKYFRPRRRKQKKEVSLESTE